MLRQLYTLIYPDPFGISCMTIDNCFYLQNRLIQTSQTEEVNGTAILFLLVFPAFHANRYFSMTFARHPKEDKVVFINLFFHIFDRFFFLFFHPVAFLFQFFVSIFCFCFQLQIHFAQKTFLFWARRPLKSSFKLNKTFYGHN